MVAGAPAQVPLDSVPDLVLGRVVVFSEESCGRHDHARGAETALKAMTFPETLLHRVKGTVVFQTLDGPDFCTVGLDSEHGAGFDRFPVDIDRACPAVASLTADVCPGQMKVLTDEMDQERPGLDISRYLLPVDCHRDFHKEVPFVESLT